MDKAFVIQTAGSLVAILALVGLAAWAKIARPAPALDETEARKILADEFPEHPLDRVWIVGDGNGAVARAGDNALVLYRIGDGFVARSLPWRRLSETPRGSDGALLRLSDVTAPRVRIKLSADDVWPPLEARP